MKNTIAVEAFYRTGISELDLCGHINLPFFAGHLVSSLLLQGTRIASKIPKDWTRGKSELCFLETLPLDTRIVGVIS